MRSSTLSGYCFNIITVIALPSILILLVSGKGMHKGGGGGGGQKLRGKEFCQDKYDECLDRHPYLTKKGSNTPEFCERQIFRSYYCKTRLPDPVATTLKPRSRDRSLGGGDEEISNPKPKIVETRTLDFYIDPPPNLGDNNSSEKIPAELMISEEIPEHQSYTHT